MTELLQILRRHAAENCSALVEACEGRPEVVVSYGTLIAYAQMLDKAVPVHSDLSGPRIVSVLSDSPLHQAIAIIAAIASGMIVNIINPELSPTMQLGQLRHAQPDLLIIDNALNPPMDIPKTIPVMRWGRLFFDIAKKIPFQCSSEKEKEGIAYEDTGGLLIYTSGTTGTPKGVLLPWSHIVANARYAIDAFGMTPKWISGSLLPRFHTFTLIGDIVPVLLLGGHAILVDNFRLSHVQHTVATFRWYGVLSYCAAPIILESFNILNAWHNAKMLRFAIAGAAPLKAQTAQEYANLFGHPIIPCYGLTETTCFATISPRENIKPGTVGRPAGIEIQVHGEHGESLPSNATGELVMRGPSVIQNGYFRDTEGCFAASFTADGWLLTGDIGRIDADGFVYVTGRKKNMAIRRGNKIYLDDVDRCLAELPGVLDCASTVLCGPGSSDKTLSFLVVENPAPSRTCINDHIRKLLTSFHVPDRLYFVERIPRTKTGKVSISNLIALANESEMEKGMER